MEKDIIVWTFIIVFIITSAITLLGVIKNCKWVEIDDKYLKALSGALLLEIAAVIVTFGASSFNEISVENSYLKEIESFKSQLNDKGRQIEKLKITIAELNKEVELRSQEINQVRKEKEELSYVLNEIKKVESENSQYTFSDAKQEFSFRPIYFKYQTSNLDSSSEPLLDSLVNKLVNYNNISIRLQPITPLNADDTLIKKRQVAIRKYLVSKGFPPHGIVFITSSQYGNDTDEIYNKDDVLLERGMYIDIALKKA